MNFLFYDLGVLEKGRSVEITLGYAANVKLMTAANFNKYKVGFLHRFFGGFKTTSPYYVDIPANDHWVVVIDLGGYSGVVKASVKILGNKKLETSVTNNIEHEEMATNTETNPHETDTIVLCEGSKSMRNGDFDARCYATIFKAKYPNVEFYSLGSCNDVEKDSIAQAIHHFLPKTQIIRLVDRDDRSDVEIIDCQQNGIKVLNFRNLESYLLDDEILIKLCSLHDKTKCDDIIKLKKISISASVEKRQNPPNDLKSAAGDIYNGIKKILSLKNCGNNTYTFLRDTMAPLITSETAVYTMLEKIIFDMI